VQGAVTLWRVGGVPVRVHASWLLIFALIAWSLSVGYFPQMLPDLPLAAHWTQGLFAALLLFVSVLLHELSHAVMAQHYGIPVSSITLHVFGGISELRREPARPGIEFAVAIVGPLTSFGIAGVLAALESMLRLPAPAAAVARYLALVNVALGVFNLAPGFPLDGGRVLRAALWKRKGDLVRATELASRAGAVFATILMAIGVFRVVKGDFVDGVWLVVLGTFLRQGAEGSYQQLLVQRALAPLSVRDAMTGHAVSVPHDLSVARAMEEFFWRHHVSSFPVLDDQRLVGIVAIDGLKRVSREHWATTPITDVMRPIGEALTAAPGDSLWSAFQKLSQNGLGRLAVVDDGRLVGYLSAKDVTHLLALSA
jgi:Zn-dependent protease/predicted transcriptional regulator